MGFKFDATNYGFLSYVLWCYHQLLKWYFDVFLQTTTGDFTQCCSGLFCSVFMRSNYHGLCTTTQVCVRVCVCVCCSGFSLCVLCLSMSESASTSWFDRNSSVKYVFSRLYYYPCLEWVCVVFWRTVCRSYERWVCNMKVTLNLFLFLVSPASLVFYG